VRCSSSPVLARHHRLLTVRFVMDQKVTTHAVLAEPDSKGIKFLTLRMRSSSLVRHIAALAPSA
jgi:hypothetical protein